MRTLTCLLGVALSFIILMGATAEDKPLTIKNVMANHKKDQLRDQVGAEIKKPEPDWAAVQKLTKDYSGQAQMLAKLEPPKGTKESWQKLTVDFAGKVKSLDDAATKQDAKTARTAFQQIGATCMTCHGEHRPKP